MKAVLKENPGRGFVLRDIPMPEIKEDEVLVKVSAVSICGTDLHIYQWNTWAQGRIKPPLVVGHEVAGRVVEVGRNVKRVQINDFVSAETHIYCGYCHQCLTGHPEICENLKILGVDTDGAFAEYIAIPERVVWVNPPEINPEFASVQEPLGNAIDTVLVEDVVGKSVLITGVGPVGLLAVGVARVSGASQIIVSDIGDFRLNIAKKMGADILVNSRNENLREIVMDATHGRGVDVGLEMSGNEGALRDVIHLASPGGRVSLLGLFDRDVTINLNDDVIFKKLRVYGITGRRIFQTWNIGSNLLKSGRLDISPVISHKFTLEEFDKGIEVMERRESGKVILIP